MRSALLLALSLTFLLISEASSLQAQESPEATEPLKLQLVPSEVPEEGVPELLAFIEKVRETQPRSRSEYVQQQMAIITAAERILSQEKNEKSPAYRTAQVILFARQLRGLITKTPEERAEVVTQVESLLTGNKLDRDQLQLGMQAASILENLEENAAAARLYRVLGNALVKSRDEQESRMGKMFLGSVRRLALVGQPLKLNGETLDHRPFRLEQLAGKVVLVDFWATWCGPCLAEIPNMKKLYAAYHEKGFEIVGLSIDNDREELEAFQGERQLPWILLHDEQHAGEHPAMTEYGIFGIPCMMLVGRDGNVISIQARGDVLTELLAKEFGPLPDEAKSDEAP